MAKPVKKVRRRREPTPEQKHELEKRKFAKSVRTVLERVGFRRFGKLADVEFNFDGRRGDFDDAFVFENVVLFVEYTISNPNQIGDHVKGKAHLFNKIDGDPAGFLDMMRSRFADLSEGIPPSYHSTQLIIKVLYCSKNEVKADHQALTPSTSFLWHGSIKYFTDLSAAVKRSARFEMFDFLRVPQNKIGYEGSIKQGTPSDKFHGSVLPEAHSNFPSGFKVISFYVSPSAVLSRAYVLRKDGWQDSDGLYQRMINRKKVESIRRHLRSEQRVFVNNVILTLPEDAKLLHATTNADIAPNEIKEVTAIKVELPDVGNSVGIVDGQHRIFSYYEDAVDDPKIRDYRKRQNLLATGIFYPPGYNRRERERFEASLFLEINSTQNAAGSPLKQAIAVITKPFSHDAVSKRVAQSLASLSALSGLLERSFYDVNVLRTTTIVSYGLKPLVKLDGDDSLFRFWENEKTRDLLLEQATLKKQNLEPLIQYTDFAAKEINAFLGAARATVGSDKWKLATKDGSGLLTVTLVNGFLALFRHYTRHHGVKSFDEYKRDLAPLKDFKFGDYKSSRYYAMGGAMYKRMFGAEPTAPAP